MKFDPMTGKPIPEENSQPKFDPATGQPIAQADRPKFDPMTGQPIQQQGFDNVNGQQANQTPFRGQAFGEAPKKAKKKTALFVGIGAVAIIAILVIVLAVKFVGMYSSPASQIETALINTFKDSQMIDTSVITKSADDLQVNISMQGKIDGSNVDADIAYARTNNEMSISADIGVSVLSTSFNFYMNKTNACFDMKGLDSPIYYNYVDEKDGDLEEFVGGYVTYDEIDTILQAIYDSTEIANDLKDANSKALASLEFEKVESQEFEVNGKDVKCKGYTTQLDKDAAQSILDEYIEALEKHGDLIDRIEDLTGTDLNKLVNHFTDDIDDDDNIELTFYIFKNQLAGIIIAPEDEDEVKILFEGGEFPTQNMEVISAKETVYEIKGGSDDGVITQEIYTEGVRTGMMTYDMNSGEFLLSLSGGYGDEMLSFSGTYEKTKGGFLLTIDDIEYCSDYGMTSLEDFEVTVEATKGANIEKIDTDDAIDIGNADKDELTSLLTGVISAFY